MFRRDFFFSAIEKKIYRKLYKDIIGIGVSIEGGYCELQMFLEQHYRWFYVGRALDISVDLCIALPIKSFISLHSVFYIQNSMVIDSHHIQTPQKYTFASVGSNLLLISV